MKLVLEYIAADILLHDWLFSVIFLGGTVATQNTKVCTAYCPATVLWLPEKIVILVAVNLAPS